MDDFDEVKSDSEECDIVGGEGGRNGGREGGKGGRRQDIWF